MYSYGPPHMAEQKQDDQLEHTYSSSLRIRDVALQTCQRRWTIGRCGERVSGISVLAARHDDDDWYVSLSIQLNISHLFRLLNDQTVLFLKIQFSISHFFAHRLNVKQFYLTHRLNPFNNEAIILDFITRVLP